MISPYIASQDLGMLSDEQKGLVLSSILDGSGGDLDSDKKTKYESVTQNNLTNLVSQLQKIELSQKQDLFLEDYQEKLLKLSIQLCDLDENACELVDNYRNYKQKLDQDEVKELKVFGIDYFSGYPLSFNQRSSEGASPDYIIRPGDSFEINIFSSRNFARDFVVNREGKIVLPVGEIHVSGLEYFDAIKSIKEFVSERLIGSETSVTLTSVGTISVFVMGASRNPGAYNISSTATSVNAIIASGGFESSASLRNIEIIRDGEVISKIDLYDLLIFGDLSKDIRLLNGDTVLIHPRKMEIRVMGEVNRPAIYEINPEDTLNDALSFGMGISSIGDSNNISIKRLSSRGNYSVLGNEIQINMLLNNADEIRVGRLIGDDINKIQLSGAVRNSGVYPYKPKQKLFDVLDPQYDLLDNTYTGFGLIKRYDPKTRSHYWLDFDLVNLDKSNHELMKNDSIFIFQKEDIEFINSSLIYHFMELDEINDITSMINEEDEDEDNTQKPNIRALLDPETYSCLQKLKDFGSDDYINSSKLKLKSVPSPSNSVCTEFLNDHVELAPLLLNASAPALGSVSDPGIYPISNNITPDQLISLAGGVLGEEYSVEFESYKSGSSSNLKFVNLKAEYKSNTSGFVKLIGAFKYPGTYAINSSTTISDIYKKAGGLNQNAYPVGAILTRNSIKEREEKALQRSEKEIADILASAITSGIVDQTAQDVISLIALMTEIGNTDAVGRLVTELRETKLKQNSTLDITLESGDAIYMPIRSNTITIVGSVLNPVTVPYDPNKDISEYIKLAGGYKDNADSSKTYVLLPNGTSVRDEGFSFGFNRNQSILPASTIVVPREARSLNGLAFAEAISPILANLSLTMASIVSISDNN